MAKTFWVYTTVKLSSPPSSFFPEFPCPTLPCLKAQTQSLQCTKPAESSLAPPPSREETSGKKRLRKPWPPILPASGPTFHDPQCHLPNSTPSHQEDHGSLKFPFRHLQANHSVLPNLFKALPTTFSAPLLPVTRQSVADPGREVGFKSERPTCWNQGFRVTISGALAGEAS